MKKAVVIGGGFTGLATAYYLAKKGFAIDLHEAGPRLGGMLSTEKTPHGLVESAANGFMLTEELVELLGDLKLNLIQPLPEFRKKRFIFRNGLKRWPLNFFETIGLIVKAGFRFAFQKKSMTPKTSETLWNWGLRNLGFAASKFLLNPGIQGIYAGNARQLSAFLILGPMFKAKKQGKSYRGTVSFKGGMQDFVDAISRKLSELPVRIHLNSPLVIQSLETPHIVCVPAHAMEKVVRQVAPVVAKEFENVEMLPVLSVTAFYQKAERKLEGFGCLFPDEQGFSALGVLSNTYIFEDRGPDYNETWIFGGNRSPKIFEREDLEILQIIQTERKRLLPGYSEFSEYRIHRWPQGLPHYTVELERKLEHLSLPKNLFLNGNYLGGIGLSKILARSQELATKIDEESYRRNL